MRFLILLASIGALVIAKPEKYREKEDFEYSRSSSDDGSKSGYYGAQRGNMGGNYEHAHNMDMLAQHQMSSLVRQVDGELGSGANQRTGSVFTSGNSRGVYGSGMYDLSNLKGRNFEESHAFGGSHSSLSSSSGAASSLGYGHEHASSNSRYSSSQSQSAMERSRYHHHSSAESASDLVMGGHQAESLHSGLTQSEYDQQAADNYKYYSGNNGYNSNSRYVSSVPTKVYIRPGQKVTIPISSQTYDASHSNALLHDHNSLNSDAEVISSGRVVNTMPITKHYESSYKYKKEWEKHDTQTFATPTENPFSQNIEHFDNLQVSQGSHHHDNFDVNSHSSSQLNKFNSAQSNAYSTGSKSSSSHQSGYHSGLAAESQNLDSSLAGSHSKDYLHEGIGAVNTVEDIHSRPKHYQSSYSYHKAWERQGDPYVIVPDSSSGGSEVQSSQKFTAASENYGHSSSHHGSQYSQSQKGYSSGCNIDCVNGHIRIARSYKTDAENVEQQSQTEWANVEDQGQQTQEKWDHLTDLGQQTQNNWENLGQQTQENWDHLGDLTQQQQSKWENQEDLGQKSQNVWDNLENLSQQSQTKWDKIEVLDQQKDNKDDKQTVGHKPQNLWGKHEDLEQKPNVNLEKPIDLHKEIPNTQENVGDTPRYVTWHEFQNFGQDQNSGNNGNYAHRVHHGHHHQNIGQEDQTYKYHNMHDVYNQEFENWKLMQSISQHLENKQRRNYFNSYGTNINPQQGGYFFGHRHDNNCHHSQDASISNTNDHNSWNTYYAQENVHHKHFTDFWKTQNSNGDIFAMQLEPHTVSKQTISENSKQDFSIHNFWDKLDKIDNTLQTQNSDQYRHNVDKKIKSTEHTEFDLNIDEDKEETHVVQPLDVGRGDIDADDLTSESSSTEQHKDNGVSSSTVIKNTETEYHNLQRNTHTTESHARTTTEDSLDLSVVGIENEPSENKYHTNGYNKNSKVNTEIEKTDQHSSKPLNVENINQHTDYMQNKADQQVDDWLRGLTSGQQSEDFGQHNLDQQLEDFQHPSTDQEDFKQPNTDQQLVDFGQQQNNDEHLEDFKQSNTDSQVEDWIRQLKMTEQSKDFGQHNLDQQLEDFKKPNTDQQLEDFKQPNTDQQLEDFGQLQNNQQLEDIKQPNTDQKLEDFKQPNTDPQVEDWIRQLKMAQQSKHFEQHNLDQQLEDFKKPNTDQQLEDFKQPNTDQQLEDFGQLQNTQQLEDFKQPNTDQKLEDFQQPNTDPQVEDWIRQLKIAQQSKDFEQHNLDQQLEDFKKPNIDQPLEDFKQPNTDQQLEDFGQLQNNQQLEDFKQPNTDQKLEDFQQPNTDPQVEDWIRQLKMAQQSTDFEQHNLDQQLKDIKQPFTDQQLEDFKQPNTDQQLEDFEQRQNKNQKLEDFKQPNTDQQLEGFKQQKTDQQLEDFGQKVQDQQLESFRQFDDLSQVHKYKQGFEDFEHTQQITHGYTMCDLLNNDQQKQKNWSPEGRSQSHLQAFEEPKGRSLELAIPPEPVITTKKPGFWKSVGNKFTGAKNTVAGWFNRS